MADIQTFGKLDFNFSTKIMELQVAYTAITLQEVYDTAHDAMADLRNSDAEQIASASGQDDLGGGLSTGITVRLLNGWRLKAADRGGPTVVFVNVGGGNLVTSEALGPDPTNPLAPAAFVTYGFSSAVSAVILTAGDFNVTQIDGSALAAQNLSVSTRLMTQSAVDDTAFTPTDTEFESTLILLPDGVTAASADVLIGRAVIFGPSGTGTYQPSAVTDYAVTGGRGHFTVSPALPVIPSNTDPFLVV